jgi:hypothetical protein
MIKNSTAANEVAAIRPSRAEAQPPLNWFTHSGGEQGVGVQEDQQLEDVVLLTEEDEDAEGKHWRSQ